MNQLPELLQFQKLGSLFLQYKRGALLADEMGVGKTCQAIDACRDDSDVIVIVPAVAKYQWQKEFLKFANREAFVVEKGETHHRKDTVIMSPNNAMRYGHLYKQKLWKRLIVDEWHMYKAPKAKRTLSVIGNDGLWHWCDSLWAMSGTPAPNHAGELWTLFYNFGVTTLDYPDFIARYCRVVNSGRNSEFSQIVGTDTTYSHELVEMLKRFALRRYKADVLDLPPIFHNTYYVEPDNDKFLKNMPDLKAKLKHELNILMEGLQFFGSNPSDDEILQCLTVMGQSISSLRRYHGFKKVAPTADLIKFELDAGLYKKVVIFGWHTDVLKALAEKLAPYKGVLVTGATSSKKREELKCQFCESDGVSWYIGNIMAAGVAQNLVPPIGKIPINQVIMIEQDWVPGNNKQAADRVHRFGQLETVNVRHIAIKNSIDEKMTETLTRKTAELSTFL